jgi:hypothetical protein
MKNKNIEIVVVVRVLNTSILVAGYSTRKFNGEIALGDVLEEPVQKRFESAIRRPLAHQKHA